MRRLLPPLGLVVKLCFCMNGVGVLLLFALAALAGPAQAASWTFLVYLDADNNLESYGLDDFLEMASVGSSSEVNIVVMMDRITGYSTAYDDWRGVRRGKVMAGDEPDSSWGSSMGELNMGAEQTLIDFVEWGVGAYPATNYAVVLWNHGNGWRMKKEDEPVKAVCWDDTSGDSLSMTEVRSALNTVGSSVGSPALVGFDACLMGMVEVAYEIRAGADVMVGSEDNEPGPGWPYDLVCGELVGDSSMTPAEFGAAIVNCYVESYGDSQTMSAIDLSQMGNLATKLDLLAQTLRDDWDGDVTACDGAAVNVQAALETAVIREQHGGSRPGSHGLSVYFPENGPTSSYSTSTIQLPGDVRWDEFLEDFDSSMGGSWVATARGETQEYGDSDFVDLYDFCDGLMQSLPDNLGVTPEADFISSGPVGGSFSPSERVYTLTNNGSSALSWAASATESWVSLSATSGTLNAGSSTTVTVSFSGAGSLAAGTYTDTVSFTNASSSAVRRRDVTLEVVDAIHWFSMDTNPGWTTTGAWNYGTPTGAGSGYGDPTSGHTGTKVYGYNLSGDYTNNLPERALTTTALDCTGYENVHLHFWRWLEVESSLYDHASVEVSSDGTNWSEVWSNPDATLLDAAWVEQTFDISAVADGESTVYIRWVMGTTDYVVVYPGWNIDDVALIGDVAGGGVVKVNVEPDSVNAGWTLTGPSGFNQSGSGDKVFSPMEAGDYSIAWEDVVDWVRPADETQTLVLGQAITFTGTYTPQQGSLCVKLEPAGAREAGAAWRVDGGAWKASGEVVSGLDVGSHTVDYGPAAGYETPSDYPATIRAEQTTTLYTQYRSLLPSSPPSGNDTTDDGTSDDDSGDDSGTTESFGCPGNVKALLVQAVAEKALPALRTVGGERIVGPEGPIAIRLTHADGIDSERLSATIDQEQPQTVELVWAPVCQGDDTDGWVVCRPGTSWAAGETIQFTVSGWTLGGEAIGPMMYEFVVWDEEGDSGEAAAELVEAASAEAVLAGAAGSAYEILPNAWYESARQVCVPLPEGYEANELSLWYCHVEADGAEWVPAGQVVGWQASGSDAVWGEEGLVLEVYHGGVVQFARTSASVVGAASSAPIRGGVGNPIDDVILLGAAMGIVLLAGRRRRRTTGAS